MLYGRMIELTVGGKQFKSGIGLDGLTILFDVPFDDDKEPNVGTIKVYNMADSTIAAIKKNLPIILNAGYQSDVGGILLGFVEKVQTTWEGVDKVTELTVIDGVEKWYNLPIKKTYAPGTTGNAILTDLVKQTGLEIGSFVLPSDRPYRGGKAFNTKLRNAIAEIAKDCGAKVHVTRGKVFIRPKNEGQTIGFVIDKDHGLISSPTPIEKDIGKGKQKTLVQGWKVITLLNHRITTDAILQIKSKTANGMFRVEAGRHDGSSFLTEMEVYPV